MTHLTPEQMRQNDQLILSSSPAVQYRCRCDKHFTMECLSPSVLRLLGIPAEEFINNRCVTFPELYHDNDRDNVFAEVYRQLSQSNTFTITYRVQNAGGQFVSVKETGSIYYDQANGKPQYLIGQLIDLRLVKVVDEFDSASLEQRALAMLALNQNLKYSELAEACGCHVRTLLRNSRIKQAKRFFNSGSIPKKGSKDQHGNIIDAEQ